MSYLKKNISIIPDTPYIYSISTLKSHGHQRRAWCRNWQFTNNDRKRTCNTHMGEKLTMLVFHVTVPSNTARCGTKAQRTGCRVECTRNTDYVSSCEPIIIILLLVILYYLYNIPGMALLFLLILFHLTVDISLQYYSYVYHPTMYIMGFNVDH